MGYDDNTPLTGVGGGGLPAEIFKETMLRVHEGLPASPLPQTQPEPLRRTAQERTRRTRETGVDRVIRNVLNELFGN